MFKNKKIFFIVIITFLIALTSCNSPIVDDNSNNNNDNQEKINYKTAYGITYHDYVGMVKMTVADERIIYLDIDEVFMPSIWAMETKKDTLSDYVTKTDEEKLVDANGLGYAKYIRIGEKILIGTPYTEEEIEKADFKRQVIRYYNADIKDLYEYLKDDKNAKWYVESVLNGKAYVCDKLGNRLDDTNLNPQGSFFKSSSLYWTTGESTWSKNIQVFSNALVGSTLSESVTTEDGYIKVGDVVTSATMEGYLDYYNLVKKAYNSK